jgi:hypothetical protein
MLGFTVKCVSVNSDGGGRTKISKALYSKRDLNDPSVGAEARIHRGLMVVLAGQFAQRRYAPRSNWRQKGYDHSHRSGTDFGIVGDILDQYYHDEEIAKLALKFVMARTERLVREHWQEIESVAARLIERGVIEGNIREAFRPTI